MVRVPEDLPLTIRCTDCTLDISSTHTLVDTEKSVSSAMEIIRTYIMETTTSAFRVPPLLFSRLARGGKTTFMQQISVALKESALYAPIFINFNGNFLMQKGESQLQALLRLIAMQLVDASKIDAYSDRNIVCDSVALLNHITQSCDGKPVVLLIDELNMLAMHGGTVELDSDVKQFLKTKFLDPAGRYLVYSSHIPLEIDNFITVGGSGRFSVSVPKPLSRDLTALRKMSEKCKDITPSEVVYYGGIPSLLYCQKQNALNADKRANMVMTVMSNVDRKIIAAGFVRSLLSGDELRNPELKSLYWLASIDKSQVGKTLVRWPICYIRYICNRVSWLDGVCDFAKKVEHNIAIGYSGLDWQTIVNMALLVRCLDAQLNGESMMFGLCGVKKCVDVSQGKLSYHCASLERAREEIMELVSYTEKPTLLQVTPGHTRFTMFDGFLCFCENGKIVRAVAYQAKLSKGREVHKEVPDWIDLAVMINGKAVISPNESQVKKWIVLSQQEVLDLLGCSLSPFYPAYWNTEDIKIKKTPKK